MLLFQQYLYAVWFGLHVASSGIRIRADVMQMKNVPVVLYLMDAGPAAKESARANKCWCDKG